MVDMDVGLVTVMAIIMVIAATMDTGIGLHMPITAMGMGIIGAGAAGKRWVKNQLREEPERKFRLFLLF